MGDDLAAANVNRSYSLAATSIAIFTFMLIFLYPRFEKRRDQRLAVSSHVGRDGRGDVLIRVRVLALLPFLAWQPDR